MQLTIKDLDTAVELIDHHNGVWEAPPWPRDIQSRPRQGGSKFVLLDRAWVELKTSIQIIGEWREDNPQPVSVTLRVSKIPQALPSPPVEAPAFPLLQKEAAQPPTTKKKAWLHYPCELQVPRQKACEHCGRVFVIDRAGRRFCCSACGAKAGGMTPVVEHTEDCPQRFFRARREDELEIWVGDTERVLNIFRINKNDDKRRREQSFFFHIFLPGQPCPWSASLTTLEQSPVCPGCGWKFRLDIEEDPFCCDPCAKGKRQHDA